MGLFRREQPAPVRIDWTDPIPVCVWTVRQGMDTVICDKPTNRFIYSGGYHKPICADHLSQYESFHPLVQVYYFRWPIQQPSRPATDVELARSAEIQTRRLEIDIQDFRRRSPDEIYWRGENPLVETIIHRHYGGRDPRRPQP